MTVLHENEQLYLLCRVCTAPRPITARLRVLRPNTGALEALVVLGVMSAASRRSGHSRRKTL